MALWATLMAAVHTDWLAGVSKSWVQIWAGWGSLSAVQHACYGIKFPNSHSGFTCVLLNMWQLVVAKSEALNFVCTWQYKTEQATLSIHVCLYLLSFRYSSTGFSTSGSLPVLIRQMCTCVCVCSSISCTMVRNKKAVLLQTWLCDAPETWMPWKISGVPDYAQGYFARKLYASPRKIGLL